MRQTTIIAGIVSILLFGLDSRAGSPGVTVFSSTVNHPETMTSGTGGFSPLSVSFITARARALGDSASGSGTRYFSVTDADLIAQKSTRDILNRLAPTPVEAGSGVRRMEVLVEIKDPVFLHVPRGTAVRIGTVAVDHSIENIKVESSIYVSQMLVTGGTTDANH